MAGSRHHILPRFLLKGFAGRTRPRSGRQDVAFVWVYRKEGTVFESSTSNVGLETHFYGKEGGLNVDDEITAIEHDFAISVDDLRARDDGYEISDDRVLQFITHLTSRTKHLRDTLIDSFGYVLNSVLEYFSDYENRKAWCIEYLKRHPEIIRNTLDEALSKYPVSAHKKAMARQNIKRMPVERIVDAMDEDQPGYESLFEGLKLKFAEEMHDIGKQGHIKFLLKNLVSEQRVEHYRGLHWQVRRSKETLILGDVGCLFELRGETRFKSLGGTEDEIERVYLPISSDRMIVGTPLSDTPRVDFVAINEAVTKCSRDFFVCSTPSPEMARLASMLGQESDMITKEEMEKVITEVTTEP